MSRGWRRDSYQRASDELGAVQGKNVPVLVAPRSLAMNAVPLQGTALALCGTIGGPPSTGNAGSLGRPDIRLIREQQQNMAAAMSAPACGALASPPPWMHLVRPLRNPDRAAVLRALKDGPLRLAVGSVGGAFRASPAHLRAHAEAIRRFLPATADGGGDLHDQPEVREFRKRRADLLIEPAEAAGGEIAIWQQRTAVFGNGKH